MEQFKKLYHTGIQTMHNAEKQIAALLPTYITSANEPQLKATLSEHLQDTLRQIARLESLASTEKFEMIPTLCVPVQALVQQGKDLAGSDLPPDVKDAAIIANTQCLDHYKMAMYGTLAAYAYALHLPESRKLLRECAKEDGEADHALSRLAEGTLFHHGINYRASQSDTPEAPSPQQAAPMGTPPANTPPQQSAAPEQPKPQATPPQQSAAPEQPKPQATPPQQSAAPEQPPKQADSPQKPDQPSQPKGDEKNPPSQPPEQKN